jgi:16S rRNA (cytidine1402-2'-O)-methyltransferase
MRLGKFIVCGNHVGDPRDVPPRTLKAIADVSYIVCDYSHTFIKDIFEYHKMDSNKTLIDSVENDSGKILKILSILKAGEDVVFICDNGMPGLADYGSDLVKIVRDAGVDVIIIPGPDVVGVSLAASGLASGGAVIFEAFFGKPKDSVINSLSQFSKIEGLLVLIDFPDKMIELATMCGEILGYSSQATFCKKVSLDDQIIFSGTLAEVCEFMKNEETLDFSSIVVRTSGLQ